MSKLLEKAIAKCFQYDIVKEELIHTNQFRGQSHSSCLDAGAGLQPAWAAGPYPGNTNGSKKKGLSHWRHGCGASIIMYIVG
jgi:hypothetical protein